MTVFGQQIAIVVIFRKKKILLFRNILKYISKMPTKREIIKYFMRTSKGIKATAGHFSISKTYVGCVITEFKKKHNIR